MVKFVFTASCFGMLHLRSTHDLRRCCHGSWARRRLLCSGLSLGRYHHPANDDPGLARRVAGLFFGLLILFCANSAAATEPAEGSVIPSSPAHATSFAISESQARSSVQWLADLAVQNMPSSFDGDKNWGCVHRGKTYLFVSKLHLKEFQSDPDRYRR